MNSLNTLRGLLVKLSSKEIAILEDLLIGKNGKDENFGKSLQLLKLIIGKGEVSANEIQLKIYGHSNYYAFNKILNRLKNKVLEVITLDASLRSSAYSKRNFVLLNQRKKLLQADILQLKGYRGNLSSIYKSIVNVSRKFEFYELEIQALNSYQRIHSMDSKTKHFNIINKKIVFAEKSLFAIRECNTIFKNITNKISNYDDFLMYKSDLLDSIAIMERHYHEIKSPTIGYYYYTLMTEFNQNQNEYIIAQKNLIEVKNILEKSTSTYTDNRYGTVLINLANNYIYLKNFSFAIKLANESKQYFKNIPLTLRIVDELLFYCFFYSFDFEKCQDILKNEKGLSDIESLKGKYAYYKSVLSFMKGDYSNSIMELSNDVEIEKDRQGWNLNKRILLIMNLIEINDTDSVDLQIQNLEKYIKRISKHKIIKKRYRIILKLIQALAISNYNFKYIFDKKDKYFQLLKCGGSEYEWEIKSPELIIFSDWFESKISNLKLNKSLGK